MAKKIGTSKSMKKYEGGGQKGPGNGNDSIPKFNPALLDKIRKASESRNGKGGWNDSKDKPKTMEYVPSRDGGKRKTMEYIPSRDGGKMEYLKKGGSVGASKKPKMAKGGSTSFGMLSVKKGIDNNPKPTAADRIAGATMKKGGSVKSKKK